MHDGRHADYSWSFCRKKVNTVPVAHGAQCVCVCVCHGKRRFGCRVLSVGRPRAVVADLVEKYTRPRGGATQTASLTAAARCDYDSCICRDSLCLSFLPNATARKLISARH
jgi:hypothetical protein